MLMDLPNVRKLEAYPIQSDVSQSNISTIEMEEIHKFDRPPFTQCLVIYALRFVVELDIHREYFNMF